MRRESERWLSEAEWDLETARILLENRRYNAACFYSHQAAEKAAKAMLYAVNEAPWGHSVRILLERFFEASGRERLEDMLVQARELDRHYIPSRYPNAHPAGTPHEAYDEETAARAVRAAEAIVGYAREVVRGARRA